MENTETIIRIEASASYTVTIAEDILSNAGNRIRTLLPKCNQVLVLTDDHVAPLYLKTVTDSLKGCSLEYAAHIIPAGEKSKTPQVWLTVVNHMLEAGLCRHDALLALGGGVIGDIGGFAAACYLRGIACVQLPTTLLAMIDSSVGGKTAVDLPGGKNLLGCFAQPAAVLCDPNALNTLSSYNVTDGLAEAFKLALLGNQALYAMFERGVTQQDFSSLIEQAIRHKAYYVQQDEFDRGIRCYLNFGHTFGHAIEKCSDYTISHGHAVSVGIACAVRLSHQLGRLSGNECAKIFEMMQKNGLPIKCPYSAKELLPYLSSDKKRQHETITFILPKKTGICEAVNAPQSKWSEWLRLATEAEQ